MAMSLGHAAALMEVILLTLPDDANKELVAATILSLWADQFESDELSCIEWGFIPTEERVRVEAYNQDGGDFHIPSAALDGAYPALNAFSRYGVTHWSPDMKTSLQVKAALFDYE